MKNFYLRQLVSRRRFLGAAGAGAALPFLRTTNAGAAAREAGGHYMGGPHSGHMGPTMQHGGTVDHAANGFNPTEILRDFDWGKTRQLADGRTLREWEVVASHKQIEIAPGIHYPAWTYDGRVPGPTLRCREGDRLRIHFTNGAPMPHTMHFHGIHPAEEDGVPNNAEGLIMPGRSTTYEFDAEPFGFHLYHCHAGPLAEHIARGMYGGFIVDPRQDRPEADEMIMVMNGFNTNFDFQGNQIYAVNTVAFHHHHEPIQVRRGELVRIYLLNILEFDPINSFHIHANFFDYYPTGTKLEPRDYTDTIVLGQAERGICEFRYKFPGQYMFHAHKSEFAELGWMGFFEVT
ncbi:MAG: multicopper oxidase domain-containing protein [Gammaproteobacteria bacterium]